MKPPPRYLTPKQEAQFDGFIRKWQVKLGLQGWRIERSARRSTALAEVKVNYGARQASYRTGPWNPPNEPTDRALEATAVHELCHVLLEDLKHHVFNESNPKAIEAAEHAIVNLLEKLLLKGST